MKQRLGERKCRQIEKLTRKNVLVAYTRGNWRHGWAEVWFDGENYINPNNPAGMPPMVNYHTGEIEYYKRQWVKI